MWDGEGRSLSVVLGAEAAAIADGGAGRYEGPETGAPGRISCGSWMVVGGAARSWGGRSGLREEGLMWCLGVSRGFAQGACVGAVRCLGLGRTWQVPMPLGDRLTFRAGGSVHVLMWGRPMLEWAPCSIAATKTRTRPSTCRGSRTARASPMSILPMGVGMFRPPLLVRMALRAFHGLMGGSHGSARSAKTGFC